MNKHLSLAVRGAAILLLAAVPFVGCVGDEYEDSLPVGLLSEATMATDVDDDNRPVNPTNVFPTDADGFFCSFKINDAPPDTEIKAEWVYVGGEAEAEIANATRGESPNLVTVYYANAMQVVSRDALYGSVLTAWTENTSDAVSYQVLEMG